MSSWLDVNDGRGIKSRRETGGGRGDGMRRRFFLARAAARAPSEERLAEEQKRAEKSDSRKLAAEVKHGAGVDCEFVLSDFYRSTAISSWTQFCGPHR